MNKKKAETPRAPFDFHPFYPSQLQQWRYDAYNFMFNHFYPIKPWLFLAIYTISHSYFRRQLLSTIVDVGVDPVSTTYFKLFQQLPIIHFLGSTTQIVLAALIMSYTPVLLFRCFFCYFLFNYKGYLNDNSKNPSITTKIWAVCWVFLKKFAPPRLETCNKFLSNLPVPKLKNTVDSYLESMKPILPISEYENLCHIATNFLENEGKKLQFYTLIYSLFKSNYVTSFWERYVYLSERNTLLINSSIGFVDIRRPVPATQARRAAHMSYLTALNMIAFNKHEIKPPADGLVYTGLYKRMFANTRIPGKYCDHWKENRYARHLAVYANGCYYKLNLFCEKSNRVYNTDELTEIYGEMLCRNDTPTDAERKLCALTHDRRETWHENRKRFFLNNPNNAKSLKIIEDSIVFFVMDEHEYGICLDKPQTIDYFSSKMLAGNGQNRWVDKTMNFVVTKDGLIGGTSEHSVADGAEYAHIMENCLHSDLHFLKYPSKESEKVIYQQTNPNLCYAERIHFEINDQMENEINRCYSTYIPFCNDLDLVTIAFTDFGKSYIKTGKCSPDAFIQMALQLTNYKDQGKFVLTYEATSARFYKNSRTETLRTVSNESCAFVNAMINKTINATERLKLLRLACNLHYMRNRKAMTGGGIDRHLFVLYVMSRATNISSQFLNYFVSQKWLLSTSQPPSMTNSMQEDAFPDASWMGANFAAVANNGYGVCYRFAGEHMISFHISSYKSAENTNSDRFRRLLIESLHEMSDLIDFECAAST